VTGDRGVGDKRREQELADRALRELFAGRPCPELPPSFALRCARRADLVAACRPLGAAERLTLRAYWATTAVVSVAMLTRTQWPLGLSPIVTAAAMASIAIVLLPVFLFAARRGGLFALMRRVMG
jgi:hypothetical protein